MIINSFFFVWNRDPDLEPAGATDDEDKKSDKSRSNAPRRKFEWSKDIR